MSTAIATAGICVAAERAAAIEYEFVERPAGVAKDFTAQPNTSLRFLTITAIDGFRVDAALGEPKSPVPAATTLVVSAHGSGGRYDAGPPGFLVRQLPAHGYSVLAINTRQSGTRINTDNFFEIRRDIEAAVYTARALGYRTIVLHGHSLGNIQVQYYAANNWDPDLKAVVLTGMFANLPWKSRHSSCRTRRPLRDCTSRRSKPSMAVAKRRAVDAFRRDKMRERKHKEIAHPA